MLSEIILKKIPLNLYEGIIIYDLDDLTSIDCVIDKILQNGYEIFEFKDVEEYRIYYEESLRNKNKKIAILVKQDAYLPWDIKKDYYVVDIKLKDIFKNLDYNVIKSIDNNLYDLIFEKAIKIDKNLSYEETCIFLLKYVYKIDCSLINSNNDLIKCLLKLYYEDIEIPLVLKKFLKSKFKIDEVLSDNILSGKVKFFRFLQNEWEVFLKSFIDDKKKPIVDFNDLEIKVYIDNLFKEGFLEEVEFKYEKDMPGFIKIGIKQDEKNDVIKDYDLLIEKLNKKINNIENHKDWFEVAKIFGDIIKLGCFLRKDDYKELSKKVNYKFIIWINSNYEKLHYLSYLNGPVMLHHAVHYIINTLKKENRKKAALIVFDGMSQFNWSIIKDYLKKEKLEIEDKNCFAFIPTITSISRQALFSGEPPYYFKDTLFSTNYDEKHFKRFFINNGYKDSDIKFIRGVKSFSEREVLSLIEDADILGIVADTVDSFVHSEIFDYKGLYNKIDFFMKQGYLIEFINKIIDLGYEVFITSDHGNISTIGQGNIKEGVLLDNLSSRVAIYHKDFDMDVLSDVKAAKFIGSNFLKDYNYIMAEGNYSFIKEGQTAISHGGISIEEVVVPFVRIK